MKLATHMIDTQYTTQAASEWLDEAIPGHTPKYWQGVLLNNRRENRRNVHEVPYTLVGKCAFYREEDLRSFAEFEKQKRIGNKKLTGRATEVIRAFGIGQTGGTSQGWKWDGASATPQHVAGEIFVQVVVNNPLTVFKLSPAEAISFGKELLEAGEFSERLKEQQ